MPPDPTGPPRASLNVILFAVSFFVCLGLAWFFMDSGGRAPAAAGRQAVPRPSPAPPVAATPVATPSVGPTTAQRVDADVETLHDHGAVSSHAPSATRDGTAVTPWAPPAAELPVGTSPPTGAPLPPAPAATPGPAAAAMPTHSILPPTPTPAPTAAANLSPQEVARLIEQYGADYVLQGQHLAPQAAPTVPPIALPPGMRLPGSTLTPAPAAKQGRLPAPPARRTPMPIITNMMPEDPSAPSPARGTPLPGLPTETGQFEFPTDAGNRARLGPRLYQDPATRARRPMGTFDEPDPAAEPAPEMPPPPTPIASPRVEPRVEAPQPTPDPLAAATGTPPPEIAATPLPVSTPALTPAPEATPDPALLAAAASPPPERLEHVVKRGGAEVKFTNVAPGWLRSPDQVATASASAKPLAGATPDNALVPSLSGKSPAEVAAALSAKLSNLTASGNAADLAPNPDALPPEVARRLGDSPSKWGAAVGDRVLPPASVRKRADAMLTLDPSSGAKSNRELLEQRIAEDWAERVAVATEARRRGITVTPEDMQRCRALLRERNGARFEEALRQAGFTDAEIEQEVQDLALAEKFVDSVFAEKFDDAKIRQVYEATPEEFVPSRRLRVSEIFKARPSDAAAARRTAAEMERLQREAAAGADFGALAEKHSESDSRRNRGDLGWLDASDRITPQMADALSELKPGGVSRVVQTADGFAIYKLEAIEEPKPGYEGAKPLVVAAIRKAIRLSAYDEAKKQTIVRIGSEVQKPRSAIAAEKKTAGRKTASARHGTRPSASEKQGQPPPAQANAGPRAITPDEFQRPAEPAPTPATPRRGWFRRQ